MIGAVCINPAFDRIAVINHLEVGSVNRIKSVGTAIGGKAINVAITLKTFGEEVCVFGFLGNHQADAFSAELTANQIKNSFITVDGDTRINTKLIDENSGKVTELNEVGPLIPENAQKQLISQLSENASCCDFFVFSGRLPDSIPSSYYAECLKAVRGKRCILDTSDKSLLEALPEAPYLIKPNIDELEQLTKRRLRTKEEIIKAGIEMLRLGARNVLISMGGKGAILVSEKGNYFAEPIDVAVRSTVGAGDTMVAGTIFAIQKGLDWKEALVYGSAAASACVASERSCLLNQEHFKLLLKKAVVHRL